VSVIAPTTSGISRRRRVAEATPDVRRAFVTDGGPKKK
jgi:hypothetical protein